MPNLARLVPLLSLTLIGALLYALGLGRWLSLEAVRQNQALLEQFVAAHFWAALGGFVALFATVTAAFIPVALVLTLAGGFLFGPWLGAAGTLAGATMGAAVTFGAVRTAFGGRLLAGPGERLGRLQAVAQGVRQNAFVYLLALRLAPVVPFNLVNVAAGASGAPWRPYLAATVIGAIPTSLIYSYLGAGLGRAFSRGQAIAPSLLAEPRILWSLLALAILALAPVVFRRPIARLTRRDGG